MKYPKFIPEGWNEEIPKITKEDLEKAMVEKTILQGKVINCDYKNNLYVNLGNKMTGIVPRNEIDFFNKKNSYRNGKGKVNKIIQFNVKKFSDDNNIILSRSSVGKEAIKWVNTELREGDKVLGIVRNIKPYGAFIEIGGGIVGLLYIEDISVARIKTPFERIRIGQKLEVMIKSINRKTNQVFLTYKELFGTWEENIKNIKQGMILKGIAREVEKFNNGIFIELKPNLVGLAEFVPNIKYGQNVEVYVKKIIPEKNKIKLKII